MILQDLLQGTDFTYGYYRTAHISHSALFMSNSAPILHGASISQRSHII